MVVYEPMLLLSEVMYPVILEVVLRMVLRGESVVAHDEGYKESSNSGAVDRHCHYAQEIEGPAQPNRTLTINEQ